MVVVIAVAITLTGLVHAQTNYNCDVDMSGSNGTSGTATCKPDVPLDQTPEYKAEAARRAAADKQVTDAFANIGNAIATAQNKHAMNKGIRKYCDQHPGAPSQWRENGQVVWQGTCPGTFVWTKAQVVERMNGDLNRARESDGFFGYAETIGDKLIVHSERASAMRFHANIANPQFFSALQSAGFNTYIYTNDADQRYEFDITHNREVTDTAKVAGTPTMATPAAPVARAATPCLAGTTLTTTSYGSACLAPTVAPTAPMATPAATVPPSAPPQ